MIGAPGLYSTDERGRASSYAEIGEEARKLGIPEALVLLLLHLAPCYAVGAALGGGLTFLSGGEAGGLVPVAGLAVGFLIAPQLLRVISGAAQAARSSGGRAAFASLRSFLLCASIACSVWLLLPETLSHWWILATSAAACVVALIVDDSVRRRLGGDPLI